MKGLLRSFHLNGQTTITRCEIQFVRDFMLQREYIIAQDICFFFFFRNLTYFAINRFLPANVPATPTPTPKKKFDLQASLAKPLPYKPHTGKLKPLSTYKEECRPTLTEAKLKSHRVDIKSTKVTSR